MFYLLSQAGRELQGYALHLVIQSALFSIVMTAGNFYVMAALWLGRRAARRWGIAVAVMNELSMLAYLITRPAQFGGDAAIFRSVAVASIVNVGIVGVLLFDSGLARFLGSARLVGWWTPRR